MAKKNESVVKKDPLKVEYECSIFFPTESVADVDADTDFIIKKEEERQARKLIFIASESISPRAVREVLGSVFTNIYAEGYPSQRMNKTERELILDFDYQFTYHRRYWDKRYYKGADYADFVEALAQNRIAELFATPDVPSEHIFANVQPLSGAPANNAIYEAFLKPGDTVMGMDLTNGGHLTHGSESNRSGKHYNIVSYKVNMLTGQLDYEQLKQLSAKHKPKMIIAGYSAYPWNIDWKKFREVADAAGEDTLLVADIAHTAGLVVAGQFNNPIGYADAVVFTTHKTLCGPRGAVILTTDEEKSQLINGAVFPGEQGGPHLNNIAAKAVSFKLAGTKQYKELMKNTVENAKYFAQCLMDLGLKLAYGGTDSHLLLIDLKCLKSDTGYPVTGEIATRILDLCGITCNKNTISGDTNAAHPTAIRFGMPWVTQRGISKPELKKLAELVNKVLTNIKPFHFVDTVCTDGTGDEIGRGKIDMEVIEEVQRDVQKIIKKMNDRLPSFRTGYPDYNEVSIEDEPVLHTTEMHDEHKRLKAKLAPRSGWVMPVCYTSTKDELKVLTDKVGVIDSADRGIIELTGDPDRVSAFLHEATTNDMLSLEVGDCKRTLMFDKKGILVDDMMVYRMPPKNNGFARFLITTHPDNTERVLTMFRFLSDEYVVFDEDKDIHAKIQGPMIVRDLKAHDENNTLTRLDIVGPNAFKLLRKLDPKIPNMKEFSVIDHKVKGFDIILSKITYSEKIVRFSLFVDPDSAQVLWKTILSTGKSLGIAPVGIDARNELRKRSGLPVYELDGKGKKSAKRPKITDVYNPRSQYLFFLTKPYFVGQKKLLTKLKQKTKKKKYVYKPENLPVRKSCLNAEHRQMGGKMVPFAGWEMPVVYANSSINDEHSAVRDTVGLFDVSHMGVFEFSGKYATRFLDLITSNYVSWLYPGQAHYSYFLDPHGNVIDDIFLYRVEKEHYMMIVNAANAEKDWAWIQAVREKKHIIDNTFPEIEVEGELTIRDLKEPKAGSDQRVDLALQGPNALKVLQKLASDRVSRVKISRLQKMEFVDVKLKGISVRIARTGYTGAKLGYEMYLHPKDAPKLWNHLIKDGHEFGLVATGLGARDSTRTEAGFPLHGNELAGEYGINPVEAGYGAFVKLHKPYFIGREAALSWVYGRDMEVVRYKMDEKGVKVVKTHDPVANERGEFIGNVTSSVSIEGYQIGLAYIKKRFNKAGTKLNIFSLPRQHGHDHGKSAGMAKGTYQLGDKTVVPVLATVLPRFPEEGELEDTNYE